LLDQYERKEIKEMPSFKCSDTGMTCPFETSADTEEELMGKIARHAKEAHGMDPVSPEMMEKVKKAIKK
jgi:predicted small metal-binding protein